MFSQPHTATWTDKVQDEYGSVIQGTPQSFDCMIEQRTQYRTYEGQVAVVGKGIVFTSASLMFQVGDELQISGETFIIKVCDRCCADGVFHHYELTYV